MKNIQGLGKEKSSAVLFLQAFPANISDHRQHDGCNLKYAGWVNQTYGRAIYFRLMASLCLQSVKHCFGLKSQQTTLFLDSPSGCFIHLWGKHPHSSLLHTVSAKMRLFRPVKYFAVSRGSTQCNSASDGCQQISMALLADSLKETN